MTATNEPRAALCHLDLNLILSCFALEVFCIALEKFSRCNSACLVALAPVVHYGSRDSYRIAVPCWPVPGRAVRVARHIV